MFSQGDSKESAYVQHKYFIACQRLHWLEESKHHFAWKNYLQKEECLCFLWAEMKTIKSKVVFAEAWVRQLNVPRQSSQEAAQEERWDGRRERERSLSNSQPPFPALHLLSLNMSGNLCPPPAPGGAGKVSLGVSYTAAASRLAEVVHWLSTASLKGTWQISRRRKNTEGGEKKINFKLTCPTGCQSHFGDTEGCLSWQDLTSRGREVTNSITGRGQRRGLGGLTCSQGWLTCGRIEPVYLSTPPRGTGGECERRMARKVVTAEKRREPGRGEEEEKKGKSGRIQGCKWWITFHQVKGNILRNNPENGAGRVWPRASEQPISSFKKTTMKLHRKWDCHERALENLGVQSLWRGERAFIHTSYPVREKEQGVYPQGQLLEKRRSGQFSVSQSPPHPRKILSVQCVSCWNPTLRHIVL